ncbi:hypothetical protein [Thermocatellispora tengchongensis]
MLTHAKAAHMDAVRRSHRYRTWLLDHPGLGTLPDPPTSTRQGA